MVVVAALAISGAAITFVSAQVSTAAEPATRTAEVLGKSVGDSLSDDSLFDGVSLAGWKNPFDWGEARVEAGSIVLAGDQKFFLVSEKSYGDFLLEVEVNVPIGGNSGIQFRSHFEKNRLWGLQAEVDTSERKWAGGLYDEGRRAWLEPLTGQPEKQAAFKPGEWNRYRIECIGAYVRIWVNDQLTADTFDAEDLDGCIALQHHGEKGLLYRFRNVRLTDLGRHRWRPLVDLGNGAGGKLPVGWHAKPGGEWKIVEGRLVGTSPASEPRHGLLVSDATVDDFVARVRFQAKQGNSGFYFRCDEVDDPVGVHGFQAEIDPKEDVGGLYETGGRGWVVQPKPDELAPHLKADDWNELVVAAAGRRVVVRLNGWKSAELRDDPGRTQGHLALQLHGGMDMHVEFAAVEMLEKVE